jgi:hypothetical protein
MRIALLLLTTASIRVATANPCHPGDVTARSDRDLQVLAGVTCLEGSLELTKNVSNLRPLKLLTEIKGSLSVVMAERLSSLRGLDALTRIGGGVRIGGPKQGVPRLRDIDGLRSLVEIGGDLWIGGGWIFEPGKSRTSRIDGVSGLSSLAVVPGVTAAAGAAAYAGIPLTHRDYAQSCVLVTGHLKQGAVELDWRSLARARQTVAVYMGVGGLEAILRGLIEHGLAPDTPAALVEKATLPAQRVVEGTAATLAAAAAAAGVKPPALLIVGEVVRLRERLAWFEPEAALEAV